MEQEVDKIVRAAEYLKICNAALGKELTTVRKRATGIRKLQAEAVEKDAEIAELKGQIADLHSEATVTEEIGAELEEKDVKIKALEQRVSLWHKAPVKFATETLMAYPPKALELADLIFAGFFAICESTPDPFATCNELSNNSMPPFLHEYFEKGGEIKRLEAELARLKTNTAKPDLHQPAPKRHRGAHFGGEPAPGTWQKINDLLQRDRLDNTQLVERLVDDEYANPTTPPPCGEPAERGEHFGAYQSPETWRKISHLRLKYRMTNTELVAYLISKAWSQ